jgi:hypothetical protein
MIHILKGLIEDALESLDTVEERTRQIERTLLTRRHDMARQDRQHPLDMIEESRLKLALLLDLVGRPTRPAISSSQGTPSRAFMPSSGRSQRP